MSRIKDLLNDLPRLEVLHSPDLENHVRCTTFPHFPKLPKELRDKVWSLASYHPRQVKLFLHYGTRESSDEVAKVPGQTRIPSLLQVNRESRHEALKHYIRIRERPRYRKDERRHASSEVYYRDYNDLRMNRPAVETKPMRPVLLYVNFAVDQFVQQPMHDRIKAV